MKKTQLKNKLGKVFLSIERNSVMKPFLDVEWIGFANDAECVLAANTMVEELGKCEGIGKLLNDNSKWEGAWGVNPDYLTNVWVPNMIKAGLTHMAQILSPDVFGAMSASELESNAAGFIMKSFKDRDEAIQWLDSVN